MGRLGGGIALLALLAAVALPAADGARRQSGGPCIGATDDAAVEPQPGPAVRFGINPAGEAGALGPRVEPVPDDPPQTLAALAELDPPGAPFVVRLNRFFWSDYGDGEVRRFLRLTRRYTRAGYLVELQLRYHPRPDQEGDIAAWKVFVRRVVRRFGRNPSVVALQVTNEVNFYPIVPDASDSAFDGARDALIEGVIAAQRERRKRGFGQLEIGFNWAYRTDPGREREFWEYLRDSGGRPFVRAVDWVGLDAYPGTVFPPAEPDRGGYRDGIVNAMSVLRECFLPIAGIPGRVPIKVEENGYPTGSGRPETEQVRAMREMVGAVHDYRGTYNVTDYRWFDLRDHRTSSTNFQHHYGLLEDDYTPKPAFETYRELVRRLAG
jgi:hypothetical protein